MSIVSFESANEKNVSAFISIAIFSSCLCIIPSLLKMRWLQAQEGPVKELLTYTLTTVSCMGSFYVQNKLGKVRESFAKNTYYRFLMNPRTNWLRFITLLSERIINGLVRPLASENCDDCFVIDDSLHERIGFKRTELASWGFDHVSVRCRKGLLHAA